MKKGLVILLVLLTLVSAIAVSAATTELDLTSVKAEIKDYDDTTSKTLSADGGSSISAKPNATIKFTLKFENKFDRESDTNYEDVYYTITIRDIDDGDDIEEESDTFDVDAGRTKTDSLELQIPLKVDKDTFTVEVYYEGYINGSTKESETITYDLDVKKDTHKLLIQSMEVQPTKVTCGSVSTLSLGLINIGGDDEDVTVYVTAPDFNVGFNDKFTLVEDPDDSENEVVRTYSIKTPADIKAGTYPVNVKVAYNKDRDSVTRSSNLQVECTKTTPSTSGTTSGGNVTTQVQAGTTTTTTTPTGNAVANTQLIQPIPVTKKSSMDQWILVVILAELILVVLGVIVLVALRKK